MFVGYADNHAGDCYEMLNLKTRQVLLSRDVQWLNRMYLATDHDLEDPTDDPTDNLSISSVPESEETDPNTVLDSATEEHAMNDNSDNSDDSDNPDNSPLSQTRRGCTVKAPTRLIEEIYSSMIEEIMAVGAGIGGRFDHTSELCPMKYEEAMATPKAKQWGKSVDMEHDRMVNHVVFKAVKKEDVPKFAKILTSTWAMKQKAYGTLQARVTARGYEQQPGEHYNETKTSSPVVNEASIFILLILICMARMYVKLNDAKGAFLTGMFSKGKKIYMKVPQGFEKFYPDDVVLLLLKTIYGLKQAAFKY